VLRDVSFGVAAGGALVLTGPNGAGKSTLLRALAGLVRLAGGSVLFDGAVEFGVGFLGHQDAVKPGLSVLENLAFAASVGRGAAGEALAA
ncbi:ATP-binding cassette domain-containing protein, partial [Klebsiella pneumoniae]|uniref:ABC transporter ATP-binding protein n=1 Tax=Klebsiella pneumoniae TaxID=573 RepID=UPI0038537109